MFFIYLCSMTKEEFVRKAIERHGNKYSYDKVPDEFMANDNVTVVCPIHGEFTQCARSHYKRNGCPKCGRESIVNARRIKIDEVISRATDVHGGKYSYEKYNGEKMSEYTTITCPIHGDFKQKMAKHLLGQGCPKCGYEKVQSKQSKGKEAFIEESKRKFGDKFDYSRVEYVNYHTGIILGCNIHGWFKITPASHLKSETGCVKCSHESFLNRVTCTTDEFIEKAREVHGDKYDYSKTEYRRSKEGVTITCPKHGDFVQLPNFHLNGSGCPKCVSPVSMWEEEVFEFVKSLGVVCEQSNREILKGKEIDIYIPKFSIGIECDGLRWHNEQYRDKDYHLWKTNECFKHGVRLIHIFEDEWVSKKEIWKSMLTNMFGLIRKMIYARRCELREVASRDCRKFLNENHIQGYASSKYNYGLYYKDELVSLMSFGTPRISMGGERIDGHYELVRFCNKLNCNVIGGASRLFSHFIKMHNPDCITSYSDKRWSLGKLYKVLGFSYSHDSKPNYFYVNNMERINRFRFRKSVLVSEGYDKDKSEHDIMLERGIYRIYDCGTMVWKWKKDG